MISESYDIFSQGLKLVIGQDLRNIYELLDFKIMVIVIIHNDNKYYLVFNYNLSQIKENSGITCINLNCSL